MDYLHTDWKPPVIGLDWLCDQADYPENITCGNNTRVDKSLRLLARSVKIKDWYKNDDVAIVLLENDDLVTIDCVNGRIYRSGRR